MRDKKIKLIYFSLQGSEVREVSLSWKRILSLMFSSFVVMLLLVGSSIALFTDFYHNARIEALGKTNEQLSMQLKSMGEKVTRIESQMQIIEEEDDDLRIFSDLPRLHTDLRKVGVGGTEGDGNYAMNLLPSDLSRKTVEIHGILDQLERRLTLSLENHKEVKNKLIENGQKIKHYPSIRPVMDGRLTDKFGMRLDPFVELTMHHDGIDISAEVGTKVYASAAGVVTKASNSYEFGRGYGKEIIIDHGYGFKTRYGHLSEILVRPGQRVNRWDPIGKVGETGRATGPHLHFEVMMNEKPVNPENYILN
jgi:hypothetical protein